MKKHTVYFLTMLMLAPLTALAQQNESTQQQQTVTLEAFTPVAHLGQNEVRCGPYFILNHAGHSDGTSKGPTINCKYSKTVGSSKGTVMVLFLKSKFRTVLTNKQGAPQVKLVTNKQGSIEEIVILISDKAYKDAEPCIPPPLKE